MRNINFKNYKYHLFICENCPQTWNKENVEISPCVLIIKNYYSTKDPKHCPYEFNPDWKRIYLFDKRTKDGIKKGDIYHRLYNALFKKEVDT